VPSKLQFNLTNTNPLTAKTDCLILQVGNQKKLTGLTAEADASSDKHLSKILKLGGLASRVGATLQLHQVHGITAQRVLLAYAGTKLTAVNFERMCQTIARSLSGTGIKDCIIDIDGIEVHEKDLTWICSTLSQARFTLHKSKKKDSTYFDGKVTLTVKDKKQHKAAKTGLDQGVGIANGVALSRDLGNTAANVCTPTYLSKQAKDLAKKHASLKTTILSEAQMKKLKMGCCHQ